MARRARIEGRILDQPEASGDRKAAMAAKRRTPPERRQAPRPPPDVWP
jgi:hypothetical protein